MKQTCFNKCDTLAKKLTPPKKDDSKLLLSVVFNMSALSKRGQDLKKNILGGSQTNLYDKIWIFRNRFCLGTTII